MKAKFWDIIFVDRTFYKHFGIYSGNNKVIHYHKNYLNGNKATVSETSIKDFLDGAKNYEVFYYDSEIYKSAIDLLNPTKNKIVTAGKFFFEMYEFCNSKIYSPQETVKRARSKIGETDYNLIFHNCEHFALWCKTGMENSRQVQNFVSSIFD